MSSRLFTYLHASCCPSKSVSFLPSDLKSDRFWDQSLADICYLASLSIYFYIGKMETECLVTGTNIEN